MSDFITIALVAFSEDERRALERFVADRKLPYVLSTAEAESERQHPDGVEIVLVDGDRVRAEHLQAFAAAADLPWVLVTADYRKATQALQAGAHEYLLRGNGGEHMEMLPVLVDRIVCRNRSRQGEQGGRDWLQMAVSMVEVVFHDMDEAVTIHDQDYRILAANEAAARMFSVPVEEMVGRRCYQVFHRTDEPIPLCPLHRSEKTGHSERSDLWEDSIEKWLSTTTHPLRDGTGRLVAFLHITRDITEQKQAEQALLESETRYRNLLEGINEGVMQVDLDSRIQYVNPKFCEMTGYSAEELIGKISYEVLLEDPAEKKKLKEINRQRLEGAVGSYELKARHKSGRPLILRVHGAPVYDSRGNIVGTIGIQEDITERKETEERIRRLLERQTALNRISLLLGRTLDIETIYETAYREVQKLVDCRDFVLLGCDEEKERFTPLFARSQGKAVALDSLSGVQTLDLAGSYRDLLAGRPIIVADLSEYEEAAALFPPDTAPPSSLLVAPMVVGEKVIGAMWLQSDHLHAYGEEDGDLLMGIAALVGMALHNAELYGSVQDELEKRKAAEEALQERVRQLRSLNVASQSLTESLDVNEVLHRIALQARDILDAYGCTLYLLDDDGATLRPVVAIEPGVEEQILNTPVPVDGSLTGKAVRQRRSLIFNDVLSEQNAYYIPDTPVYDNERILVAPLIVENRVVGVLNMDRLGDAFEQEDLALAEAFAIYAATALRNAQAFTRLQHEVEERNRAEEALRESEERYRSIFELSPFAIWIADQDGTITFANEAMAELYGLRGPRDIIGKYNIRQILPDIFQPYMELFRQGRRQAVAPFEHSLDLGLLPIPSRRDETVHVRTTLFPVPTGIDRRPNLVVVQEDISERVRAQQELQTLNRLHTVLSKSGQAIVRLKEPRALLQATCRIAVEDGGFRMAWVGVLNPQSRKVEIGAYAGEVGDYLDKLTIDLSHPSYGQGPTGKAMRSGRMYVCNDIEHDPEMAPWRQDALRLGYRASVSLPLFVADEVWGSLNLYAGVPGFFDAVELSLLQELASNLSFALDAADQQVARERAERALLKGMRQQQSLIKAVHHLAESLDLDQVLHRIGQLAKDILDAYGCTVYLLDEDGQTLRPVVALEPEGQDQIMATPIQVDASLTGRAVQERRTLIFNDLSREDTVFYVPGTPMYELERILVVPLIFEDKLFGAMNLNRLGPVFDERDQMLAEAFAIYAATALHNASTYHDLQSEMEQRRQAEEALRTSLREKEVLLQELYHRTKNNMQVISAMLSLEEARVEDPTVSEVFREVQNRIRVMALVHQKLYQSKDLSRIDLSEYVQDLCRLLMQSYNVSPDRIKLKLNVQDTQVLMDIAIPCGLILNELISNAFKYAFPNNAEGEIQVTLKRSPEGDIELVVSDNGVGVPPDFDFRQSDTLGLYTVFAIVEHQLQGEIDFESDHGLTCRIRFNEQIYFERV